MASPFPYLRNCHDCLLLSQYGFVTAAGLMEPCLSSRRTLERSEPDRLTGALVLFARFLRQTSVRTFSTGRLHYINCKPVSKAVFGMGPLHPEPSVQAAREIRLWARGASLDDFWLFIHKQMNVYHLQSERIICLQTMNWSRRFAFQL
ncbi:MAG TPA: hypothetical protein DEA75_02470 [Rhodobacteraceae bacterium]|jgi:hypothetical protein|nr:hypothetical protein [Paracoccaceae bacterium]